MKKNKKITLLFNANMAYDRKVIAGVARYLQRCSDWDLYLEEDLVTRLERLSDWRGDGFIADFDNPKIAEFVMSRNIPTIAVGGSYVDSDQYPSGMPYVATNNHEIARLGVEHLLALGYRNMAFYGMPSRSGNRWAKERELAFSYWVDHLTEGAVRAKSYRGTVTSYHDWGAARDRLIEWLERLPKPVGVMAVTDARARQILEACHACDLKVPSDVAVLGVDDDEVIRDLTRRTLSSVRQGSESMGYLAAQLLDDLLDGAAIENKVYMVDPVGVIQSASTDYLAVDDLVVAKAIDFIKMNACEGIQAAHVLRHLHLSRANVENRFKKSLGSSIHKEITKVQLDQVKHLLLHTSLTLSEISERTGYTTVQYMVAVFKKQMKITPTEFRSKA